MKTKVILFFLDNAQSAISLLFYETRRPSTQVEHLLVDSSENQLDDVYKGVQKKGRLTENIFLHANFIPPA